MMLKEVGRSVTALTGNTLPTSCGVTRNVSKKEQIVIGHVLAGGSPQRLPGNIKLDITQAERVCTYLRVQGLAIQPYDLKYTLGVWQAKNEDGIDYSKIAIKELIVDIAKKERCNYKTIVGFKKVLAHLTSYTFGKRAINQWGTRLVGLLNANESEIAPCVLALIESDPDFAKIHAYGICAADFPEASNGYYSINGEPTPACIQQTKKYLLALAKNVTNPNTKKPVNCFNPYGFKALLPHINKPTMSSLEFNKWGTKLSTALQAYGGSPASLILALVRSDPDFRAIAEIGIEETDFRKVPNNTWIDKKGRPTHMARRQVGLLLQVTMENLDLNHKQENSLLQAAIMRTHDYHEYQCNFWGSTAGSAIDIAYNRKYGQAIIDYLSHLKPKPTKLIKLASCLPGSK